MATLARVIALATVLFLPLRVWGQGLALAPSPVAVAYYYPFPVSCAPVVTFAVYPLCIPPFPCPLPAQSSALGRAYAPPTAAPPSAGPSARRASPGRTAHSCEAVGGASKPIARFRGIDFFL